MDSNDFCFIEDHLRVVLPEVFKKFMEVMPNDPRHALLNHAHAVPCDGESFTIFQLRSFFNADGFDYYELQPELRSRRFLNLGGDGIGNYYCMPGDAPSTDELWFWEHDPYTGLAIHDKFSLSHYLHDLKLSEEPDPFISTRGVYICRTDHPFRSPLNPIPMHEWIAYVQEHSTLELDENCVVPNPFAQEKMVQRRWPGRVKITTSDLPVHISHRYGALSIDTKSLSPIREYADQIAAELKAKLWVNL